MPKLPQFQDDNQAFQLMQNAWASIIEPFISNPANQTVLLKNQALIIGSNKINTKLGRILQGWSVVRKRAAANIYDTQDTNPMPELTLVLVSDANVTIDLVVF